MKKVIFGLLLLVTFVSGRTVKLSNVPPENYERIKTYELEVPGRKNPIRIIEAEPHWTHRESHELDYERVSTEEHPKFYSQDENFHHLKTSTDIPPTSTPLSEHNLVENSTKIYSPEALNAFLKSYAEKLREKSTESTGSESLERRGEFDKESGHFGHSIEESDDDDYDKSQRWGLVDTKKHDPYKEKDGWVQMEAIPWSSSQISKWQSNHKPVKPARPQEYNRPDPYHSISSSNEYHKPSYSSYEGVKGYQRPNRPTYEYAQNSFSVKPNLDFDRVYHKPSYAVHVSNRPSWNDDPKPYVGVEYPDSSFPVDEDRDIITDGRPSNFPSSYSPRRPYEPLQARPTNSIRPPTHPQNGNGEWVLLSTTKGYQYPRQKKERAIAITPNSIGVKRSVQLTVLPPEKNSKINMTTSHGGLLEVDATFETVEESQKIMSERLRQKNTTEAPPKVLKLKKKKPQKSHPRNDEISLPVVPQDSRMHHNHHRPDTSAVLAAIGAGMVPAAMAMMMPFVGAGKRRRRSVNFTNVPLEFQLPNRY